MDSYSSQHLPRIMCFTESHTDQSSEPFAVYDALTPTELMPIVGDIKHLINGLGSAAAALRQTAATRKDNPVVGVDHSALAHR